MKKIMFDDRFGLTQAVLEGRKTMTRRIVSEKLLERAYAGAGMLKYLLHHSSYKAGEVVAVAQSYREIEKEIEREWLPLTLKDSILKAPGYNNKMFVKAELMPHQIRITSAHIELLQVIGGEDCMREGIYRKTCYPPGDINYFYHSEPKSKSEVYPTPRDAFAGLIDKVSGKGTWKSNPWVYVYEFELVK